MIDKTAYVISLCKDDIAVIHGLIQDRSRGLEHILCQLDVDDPIPQNVDRELYALENLSVLFLRLLRNCETVNIGTQAKLTTMQSRYRYLDAVEKLGFIEKAYEVYCPKCRQHTGYLYDSFSALPDTFR